MATKWTEIDIVRARCLHDVIGLLARTALHPETQQVNGRVALLLLRQAVEEVGVGKFGTGTCKCGTAGCPYKLKVGDERAEVQS